MKKALSIIEVMFALTLVAVIMAATSPVLLGAMQSNGDSRIRAQSVSAAEGWHDRFRASTLDFNLFTESVNYDYGYDYANDPDDTFIAAGDPTPEALNREWQDYKFIVTTTKVETSPIIWKVNVQTVYKRKQGGEGSFELSTLITQ